MLTQQQIQEIARKQDQKKKNGAALLMKLGVTVVTIACYGFLYNQDTDWVVVLVFGFAVTVYGIVNTGKYV
jgi:hypothetical protein